MSVRGCRLQTALERLDTERGSALDLGSRHRLEHPVAQRQPDPDRPAQARAVAFGPKRGIDVDAHAIAVLAVEREAGRWLERGDPRLEGPGASRGALLDNQ